MESTLFLKSLNSEVFAVAGECDGCLSEISSQLNSIQLIIMKIYLNEKN